MSTKAPVPVSQSVLGVPDGRIPESINTFITVIIAATGVPQQLPGIRPGHQGIVRIRAHNGQAAGNVAPVQIADYREAVAAAFGAAAQTLTPNTETIFPTDNTGKLWISGTLGDGVQISVKGAI